MLLPLPEPTLGPVVTGISVGLDGGQINLPASLWSAYWEGCPGRFCESEFGLWQLHFRK